MGVLIAIALVALGMWILKRFNFILGIVVLVLGVIAVLGAIPGAMGFATNTVTALGNGVQAFINSLGGGA